jgi:hypothetical protein
MWITGTGQVPIFAKQEKLGARVAEFSKISQGSDSITEMNGCLINVDF